jgi:hypothetical protein
LGLANALDADAEPFAGLTFARTVEHWPFGFLAWTKQTFGALVDVVAELEVVLEAAFDLKVLGNVTAVAHVIVALFFLAAIPPLQHLLLPAD